MIVVVRRFDSSGDTLPSWKALASDGTVAFLSPAEAEVAALNPPSDADLRIGDLVAIVPVDFVPDIDAHVEGLFVVTPDGVRRVPDHIRHPWLAFWGRSAAIMLECIDSSIWPGTEPPWKFVDPRRLVMAACYALEQNPSPWPRSDKDRQQTIQFALEFLGSATAHTPNAPRRWECHDFVQVRACEAVITAVSAARRGDPLNCLEAVMSCMDYVCSTTNGEQQARILEVFVPLPVLFLSWFGYPDAISLRATTDTLKFRGEANSP